MPVAGNEGVAFARESESNQVIVVRVIGHDARRVYGIVDKETFFR